MKSVSRNRLALAVGHGLLLAALPLASQAQSTEQATTLDAVQVTGSRIKQTDKVTQAPVAVITRQQIEKTGLASVGELLQQLSAGGKALNAKFNSSGNFGYPADGGGIGAGSAQVDLRHLGSQRVLVLVDGIRWVNESSASGVSGSADLNTIPLAIIERVEILEDGASAIYGSDAIAGVVNLITRRSFDGAAVHAYYGEYEEGGDTSEASIIVGGGGDRFSAVFSGSYYDQQSISSLAYGPASVPVPGTGLTRGSSATPQGRFTFCDPAQPANSYGYCDPGGEFWYDLTLNDGVVSPVWNPADPSSGSYHNFGGNDRFNYAPYNLLLTPSERKSLFTSVSYDISDNTRLHVKALYNNRQSTNQAAPEPLFVGPFAGTGGIADGIFISALNPYNPFGIDLDPNSNFGWITKRPVEVGPRTFNQDVDTWYFNVGLSGSFEFGERGMDWDANYVRSENSAEQIFQNGYNMANVRLALGDPALCAMVPGCVPLDLFGGQGRPMTQDMIDWIRATQIDASKQTLELFSFNVTGDLFDIGGRSAGFAAGAEHRRYQGDFRPDPLRQTGESQDSFAAPVSADYDVSEVYAELNLPLADSFDVAAALRYSDYSTFGDATTGKVGFRWQPLEELVLRGTYSEGFRAPNLGELYGLTQFGAVLNDPCSNQVLDADGVNNRPLEANCRALGVPSGYEQANTQITTFTGGSPLLSPEESESYTLGAVWSPGWADNSAWASRFDVEVNYYHHQIDGAVQARDIQALLDSCVASGSSTGFCSGFTRGPSGNLNPPTNFLDNLGSIETDGVDVKVNWASAETDWGLLTASLQATHVIDYLAVDVDGNVSSRQVGVEVGDSAIPDWQINSQFGWRHGDWDTSWNVRYISSVTEVCSDFLDGTPNSLTNLGLCSNPSSVDDSLSTNTLGGTTYHDLQVAWNNAFAMDGMKLSLGVNNVFGKDPPICLSCSLNGYDAGTYDLPAGRFWYLSVDYKF